MKLPIPSLPLKVKLSLYALLAVALAAAIGTARYQYGARQELAAQLKTAQADLDAAEENAAKYYAANQELVRRLADLQMQADTRRAALSKALNDSPEWAAQRLPETVKKAVKK